ncbi:hypothetical protein NQ317_005314 [Molorchus minor]|uniref:Uncharacterized protein n=1 Tax=Molorchus minor TaxID=1323400 RepID=A0ABQ9K145_9CUCU|nr:hypothetical protein NQ317_005314 [Molorchus minor]
MARLIADRRSHRTKSSTTSPLILKNYPPPSPHVEECVILAEVQFEARGLQCAEDKIDLSRMSEEIVEAANIAISNLLPTKSRSLSDIATIGSKSGALRKMFKYTARMFCWHTSVKMQRITSLPIMGAIFYG